MTLTLLACLLITAQSTLTGINSFGFIWKSLASLCLVHLSLFSSPRVRIVSRSSWKNLGKQAQSPGSQSPHISHRLLPRLGLLFWSDTHSFSLNSLQCFQHPGACVSKPQCRIPTVCSSAFSRLLSLRSPGSFLI